MFHRVEEQERSGRTPDIDVGNAPWCDGCGSPAERCLAMPRSQPPSVHGPIGVCVVCRMPKRVCAVTGDGGGAVPAPFLVGISVLEVLPAVVTRVLAEVRSRS